MFAFPGLVMRRIKFAPTIRTSETLTVTYQFKACSPTHNKDVARSHRAQFAAGDICARSGVEHSRYYQNVRVIYIRHLHISHSSSASPKKPRAAISTLHHDLFWSYLFWSSSWLFRHTPRAFSSPETPLKLIPMSFPPASMPTNPMRSEHDAIPSHPAHKSSFE